MLTRSHLVITVPDMNNNTITRQVLAAVATGREVVITVDHEITSTQVVIPVRAASELTRKNASNGRTFHGLLRRGTKHRIISNMTIDAKPTVTTISRTEAMDAGISQTQVNAPTAVIVEVVASPDLIRNPGTELICHRTHGRLPRQASTVSRITYRANLRLPNR